MKKQRYIVEIEMPDGDFISAGWLKDLIQRDCDVEDESRKKVTVQETSISSNLDEAAEEYAENDSYGEPDRVFTAAFMGFEAGAKWMAGQGETHELTVESPVLGPPMICCPVHADNGDKIVVQIRKK